MPIPQERDRRGGTWHDLAGRARDEAPRPLGQWRRKAPQGPRDRSGVIGTVHRPAVDLLWAPRSPSTVWPIHMWSTPGPALHLRDSRPAARGGRCAEGSPAGRHRLSDLIMTRPTGGDHPAATPAPGAVSGGAISTMTSTSTGVSSGSAITPTALRACLPASPNTSTNSWLAPLITVGCSENQGVLATKPTTLTTRTTADRSPTTDLIAASALRAHCRA